MPTYKNPHNFAYGSTAATGLLSVSDNPIADPPMHTKSDDATVDVQGPSAHDGHGGILTFAHPAQARAVAAQAGPRDMSFDMVASGDAADATYTYADVEVSPVSQSQATGAPASCQLQWAGKALTVT